MSFGVALILVVLLILAGGLVGLRRDLEALRKTLAGREVRLSKRARALFVEVKEASDALEWEMARQDIQAYAKARLVFAKQVPRKLSRAVSFLGAALGLIELALGTTLGEVRWTGVACLGVGVIGHVGVGWMGRDLARRAEQVHKAALAYSVGRPQTFVVGGP